MAVVALTTFVLVVCATLAWATTQPSAADSAAEPRVAKPEARVSGARCKPARLAVPFYRAATWRWQEARSGSLADRTPVVRGKSCHWARYAASEWVARTAAARRAYARWERERLLDARTWLEAVREVQRVFPGTEGWLLSCSEAESNHYEWVGYGGQPYSTWLRDSDTVGGYLQFRYSTFKGMFRRGAEYAVARSFRLPAELRDTTAAWRSALGQAIAGGWARYTGEDDQHWIASWSNGCR